MIIFEKFSYRLHDLAYILKIMFFSNLVDSIIIILYIMSVLEYCHWFIETYVTRITRFGEHWKKNSAALPFTFIMPVQAVARLIAETVFCDFMIGYYHHKTEKEERTRRLFFCFFWSIYCWISQLKTSLNYSLELSLGGEQKNINLFHTTTSYLLPLHLYRYWGGDSITPFISIQYCASPNESQSWIVWHLNKQNCVK